MTPRHLSRGKLMDGEGPGGGAMKYFFHQKKGKLDLLSLFSVDENA